MSIKFGLPFIQIKNLVNHTMTTGFESIIYLIVRNKKNNANEQIRMKIRNKILTCQLIKSYFISCLIFIFSKLKKNHEFVNFNINITSLI